LCHCIRFASSRYQAEDGTCKNGADAGVCPQTGFERIDEAASMATIRIHSHHKFSPRHGLLTARRLHTALIGKKAIMELMQSVVQETFSMARGRWLNGGCAIGCAQ
jgi:hypothetical protein